MSGYFLVNQSPPSFNWCSNGLQNNGGFPTQTLFNAVGSNPVYLSPNGTTPSLLNNKRGNWNYTFVKTGKTTGTATGTATTSTSFTDNYNLSGGVGVTNYTLTITDSNTGISNVVRNSVAWGMV
uniref:Uncharacterized protein n=1 Tax=viral metagenome TaxID=1070528 RepID=A0A6C0KM13_9ZZZZ